MEIVTYIFEKGIRAAITLVDMTLSTFLNFATTRNVFIKKLKVVLTVGYLFFFLAI